MNVQSYLFQSPSPQQVQIGRPDPSTAKEETDTKAQTQNTQVQATPELNTKEPEALKLNSANQILDLYV